MERQIQHAISIGQANKEVIELAQNWCANIVFEPCGGRGLVEQQTGLPIGLRRMKCPYANSTGLVSMNLLNIALSFYDQNCVCCKDRRPVRMPNILKFVNERNEELRRREAETHRVTQKKAAQIEGRAARRTILAGGSDASRIDLFNIIDRLDRTDSRENANILLETARAASEKFDEGVQEALFELADSEGWFRTETALETLALVQCDRKKLVKAALEGLARFGAMKIAGSIISKWLDASHRDFLLPALATIVRLASPVESHFVVPGVSGAPEPLLVAYKHFPNIVFEGLGQMLLSRDKRSRIHACKGAKNIIDVDPDFGPKIARNLIVSLELPDDNFDEGSAGAAVAETLGQAMKHRWEQIDFIIQEALPRMTGEENNIGFSVYEQVLESNEKVKWEIVTPAARLAFQRIVEIITNRPKDKRFEEAASFFRDHGEHYPLLLEDQAETLLGAAALIAGELENPYSPLLDPRPNELKVLEAHTRKIHLEIALEGITKAVGYVGLRKPKKVGNLIVKTIEKLGDSHDSLKASLVETLGIIGQCRDGLAVALPALYTAMTDLSQQVRSAAAKAYGIIAKENPDDLPSLVHEVFLIQLSDPYVIVHGEAIRSLRRVLLPDRFRNEAIWRIVHLISLYSANHLDDGLLVEFIDRFLEINSKRDTLPSNTVQFLIQTISKMDPPYAARSVVRHGWRLREGPGYYDLVVRLIGEPSIYEGDVDDLAEELSFAPEVEIHRLAGAIQTVAGVIGKRDIKLIDDLLYILSTTGEWTATKEVAIKLRDQFEDTRWDRPSKLRALARQVAAELEEASASGLIEKVVSCAHNWQDIYQEIRKEDEARKEIPFPI
jgi:hypothetical protein